MGTHIDGLNHLQVGDRTYNGLRVGDIVEEYGTNRWGSTRCRKWSPAACWSMSPPYAGRHRLSAGDVVTVRRCPRLRSPRHGAAVRRGDACSSTPGGADSGASTTTAYGAGSPAPASSSAQWLAEQGVALTGCDTWSFGPYPAEDPDEPFVVPQTLNVSDGVVVLENLRLAEAAAAGVREFCWWSRTRSSGARQAPGSRHSPSSEPEGPTCPTTTTS